MIKIKQLAFTLVFFIFPLPAVGQLRISVNLPLSGGLATYGASVREGIEMFTREHPEAANVLNFNFEDNQGTPSAAVTSLRRQLNNSPQVYISGVKPQTMAIWDEVGKANIPHFVWIFDREIRSKWKNTFRTYVNFRAEAPSFIDYAKKVDAQRVALIYVQLPSTDETYLKNVVPAIGKDKVLVLPYDIGTSDFSSFAARIKEFKPDLIILSGFQDNLVSIVRRFRELNLIQEKRVLATYDIIDACHMLHSNECEGILAASPEFLQQPYKQPFNDWRTRFMEFYSKEPLYTHAYAYDMAAILFNAATECQKENNCSNVSNYISKVSLQGITGRLLFDDSGDLPLKVSLGVFRGGKLLAGS
jgi:ABC-type branched-subunit amino acid transport system substrate-binding protein